MLGIVPGSGSCGVPARIGDMCLTLEASEYHGIGVESAVYDRGSAVNFLYIGAEDSMWEHLLVSCNWSASHYYVLVVDVVVTVVVGHWAVEFGSCALPWLFAVVVGVGCARMGLTECVGSVCHFRWSVVRRGA